MTATERPLADQTALVTGAGRRLGRAIALGLAADGADLIVHYRSSAAEAEAVADDLSRGGARAWTVHADLADHDAAAGLVERCAELTGRPVDVLVNSASTFTASSVLEFTPEELSANLDVNALGPLLLARGLAAQDRPGQVVNLLDTRIVAYDHLHAAYHLAKRMLFTITRMLALELAPRVRVNAVAPGLVLPPPGETDEYLERLADTNPLLAHGAASDIVRAVRFLLTSPFVTGQVIYVDGGHHMHGRTYGG